VICSGSRAADLATRLKYAGVEPARIELQADLARALDAASQPLPGSPTPLYALPTYTAMLALRELLVARGEASSAWS
jgi:lipid II isoglutaminyl synthase (glutamine-hydrolysing)